MSGSNVSTLPPHSRPLDFSARRYKSFDFSGLRISQKEMGLSARFSEASQIVALNRFATADQEKSEHLVVNSSAPSQGLARVDLVLTNSANAAAFTCIWPGVLHDNRPICRFIVTFP